VAALTLRDDSVGINELSLERPVALCLGTEEEGLSREAHDLADTFVQLPMYGFTQSFNVSVTAALSLYTVARRLHKANVAWRLPDEEKRDLLLQWLQQSIPRGETVARHFLQRGE
jgi:tRNA (guanosine-2'-O-)-methyltransferase